MSTMMSMSSTSNTENVAPSVLRRIIQEVKGLLTNPPEGIKLQTNEKDITDIKAIIEGPRDTPYAGGQFRVQLALGKDFPSAPPKGVFLTEIFHPNVDPKCGEICVNTLKKDWKPTLGLEHILLTIKCLLIAPNPESALNEDAGKLLLEQYDMYFQRAKMMTEIHAIPGSKPVLQAAAGDRAHHSKSSQPDKLPGEKKKQKDKQRKALKRL